MEEIQVSAHLSIHPGKLAEFKTVAEQCMKSVREKDTGTLQYDWFLNEDQTVCRVREKYRDSDAVLEHMGNLGETLGHLLTLVDMSLEVYGTPSEQLLMATEGMDIKWYSSFLIL